MKKRKMMKVLAVTFAAIILLSFFLPGQTLGWSAALGNRTHADIDKAAYDILSADPAFKNVRFPALPDIQEDDWVNPATLKGTGPDVVGSSNASAHFYNPRLEVYLLKAGGGPDAAQAEYTKLVKALSGSDAAALSHAASWAAHYIADVSTPYHTQGAYRSDILKIYNDAIQKKATTIPLPDYITGPLNLSTSVLAHDNDFKNEIEAFIAGTAGNSGTEDWFDPWYWDGRVDPLRFSSHVTFEGVTLDTPGAWWAPFTPAADKYSQLWNNAEPSFDSYISRQAAQVRQFAIDQARVSQRTTDAVKGLVSSATPYLQASIESAATVWRASFSALTPSVTLATPDKSQPQRVKVVATVGNIAGADVKNVQARITVTGGTLKSADRTATVGLIKAGATNSCSWEAEASSQGYWKIKVEVIGKYEDTPDLQYAVTEFTAPGILPVSVTNTSARRSHSIVFCLDNSNSMSGKPIQDAMNAGVQAVTNAVGSELEMALYFFGQSGCEAPKRMVDFTVDRERIKTAMKTAKASGNTPLAAAITAAGDYIHQSGQGAEATIILLTDGLETCSGDPVAAARALNPGLKLKSSWPVKPAYAASSTPIKLQVIGFNIGATGDETYLKKIAEAGNGSYYPAGDAQQLVQALNQAIKEGTGGGFQFQTWWFIAAGGFLLLIIIISIARRGKRAPAPAAAPAGTAYSAPPQMGPAVNALPGASFCPGCGARLQAGAAFCTGCGKPVAAASPAFCPRCGTAVTSGSAFCSKCGVSLAATTPFLAVTAVPQGMTPAEKPRQKVKKGVNKWLLFVLFLLIMAFYALVQYLVK